MGLKIKYKFCLCLTALLVVDGCSPGGSYSASTSDYGPLKSENILVADGDLNAAEDGGRLSPLEAHLRARQQVDPTNMQSTKYTSQGHAPHEETHFRVVRIDEDENSAPPPVPGRKKNPQHVKKMMPAKADLIVADIHPAAGDAAGAVAVTGLRVGDHPGKTRLVLDLSGPSGYSYKIDNDRHVLHIELPGTVWNAETQKMFNGNPLMEGYTANSLPSGGTALDIELKRSSKLLASVALKPNETYGHRIYFDVSGS